jgi:hypothetical protein
VKEFVRKQILETQRERERERERAEMGNKIRVGKAAGMLVAC